MSEKTYIWLLKLYPAAFREEFSAAALQLFLDRLRAERGVFGRCRLWFDVIVDLAVSIPREYRRRGWQTEPQPGVYRLSEEAVAAMMTDWRMSRLNMMLYFYTAVVLGVGIGWLGGASRPPLLVMFGLLAPLGVVLHYWRTSRFKRFWLGYELIVGIDGIQQKHVAGHNVTVFRSDITGLIESRAGLGVLAGQRRPVIWVPSHLVGYEQIREHLAAWTPISRPDYLKDDRRIFRPGRAMKCLIIVSYVPAVLVRSQYWFVPLALVSATWLYAATSRHRRERRWIKGVILPLAALVPLVVNAIALLGLAR
jgi:hypothetical protein